MILRNIERLEVMKVVLDFRSMSNIEPGPGKDLFNPAQRARDRVERTKMPLAAWERNVDPLGIDRSPALLVGNYGGFLGKSLGERIPDTVHGCTKFRTECFGLCADLFQLCGDCPLPAE